MKEGIVLRRKDKEITDHTLMEKILLDAPVCRVAMCCNNLPYVVPMNFGYKNDSLYLHAAKEGQKIKILEENPHVCFETETMVEIVASEKACNWSVKYFSVIGEGTARFISDPQGKRDALDILMEKYAGVQKFDYPESSLNAVHVIEIKIEKLTGKKSGYQAEEYIS
jgi:nitroimidazol reductase NimA-like FMN-containing flavoprotein (pyridoxamine 5'-phosphate oxidase superfamily)